jgi:hypothetical protein
MVGSTRNRDYNDPSVQNKGAGEQAGASNQARASQHFEIEAEFRKLQQLVQSQAKEIEDLKEQQRKRKHVVIEDDSEEDRAEKHTQANPENLEKDNDNAEKQQRKSIIEGDKEGNPKTQERQHEGQVSRRHEGAHINPEWRGPTHHPFPLGASKPDNLPVTRSTWAKISRISDTSKIPSRLG